MNFKKMCDVLCAINADDDWTSLYSESEIKEDDFEDLMPYMPTENLQENMDYYISKVLLEGSRYALDGKSGILKTLNYFLDNGCSFNKDIISWVKNLSKYDTMEDLMREVGVIAYIFYHFKDRMSLTFAEYDNMIPTEEEGWLDFPVTTENILIAIKTTAQSGEDWLIQT
jgi:hypothetical protein